MQIDDGLSEGNLGGLFSFWPSLLSFCSRYMFKGRDQSSCLRSSRHFWKRSRSVASARSSSQRPNSGLSLRATLIPMDLASTERVATTLPPSSFTVELRPVAERFIELFADR